MPIYEYGCAACGRSFEELVLRKADEAQVACPRCGGRKVERQMSRPAALRPGGGESGGRSSAPCGPVG